MENSTTKTKLYLVRHGEGKNYIEKRNAGQWDVGLTKNGVDQIRKLAERLKKENLNAIFASDLVRTRKSAEIIANYHKLDIINIKELREINIGKWEGKKFSDIFQKSPAVKSLEENPDSLLEFRMPGGESFCEVQTRVIKKFKEIIKEMEQKTILIVGHKVVNQFILSNALGLEAKFFFRIEQNFGCLNIIDYYRDSSIVQLING